MLANAGEGSKPAKNNIDSDDDRLRFTVGSSGRRLSKQEFIQQLQQMDPKTRRQAVEQSDAPRAVKDEVHADAIQERETGVSALRDSPPTKPQEPLSPLEENADEEELAAIKRVDTAIPGTNSRPTSAAPSNEEIPEHDVNKSVAKRTLGHEGETAAARRRRLAAEADSDDDGTERVVPDRTNTGSSSRGGQHGESAAERRRRLAALGEGSDTSDSDDDGGERQLSPRTNTNTSGSERRIQWGEQVSGGDMWKGRMSRKK